MSEQVCTTSFRVWPKNQKRLALLKQLKVNKSQIMNEALDSYFSDNYKRLVINAADELKKLEAEVASALVR